MIKRLICSLLGIIMLFSAVACSPANESEDTTETSAAESETTEEPEETEEPFIIKEDSLVFVQSR